MKRIAVFPGSFDPVTVGHVSIVKRALPLFDKIIIGIGVNSEKKHMFSLAQRMQWLDSIFESDDSVSVESYSGLTINFCVEKKARYILRGLRTSADFEFERGIGQINRKLESDIETVFLLTEPEFSPISSSIVRDVIRHGGNVDGLIPNEVNI